MQRVSSWVQDAMGEFLGSRCKERVLGFKRPLNAHGQLRMRRVSSWVQVAKSEFMGSGCNAKREFMTSG